MLLKSEQITMYRAFGLRIASELLLPELPELKEPVNRGEDVQLRIVRGDRDTLQQELGEAPPYKHVVKENKVMFHVPDQAYYSVCADATITVCPLPGADDSTIRLYLLGSCMGAALLQKGVLPLHGSAVAIQGKAYAFVGESGAGKSTLASAFLREGCPLVSDDVIAVSWTQAEPSPFVTPSYPQQKLWQESLDHFGLNSRDYASISGRTEKYCVPVTSSFFPDRPLPLAAVIELVKTDNGGVELMPIGRLERLHTLFWHTYRQFLLPRLGLMEWHFNVSMGLVNRIGMYRLHRPSTGFTASELVRKVRDLVEGEGDGNEQ